MTDNEILLLSLRINALGENNSIPSNMPCMDNLIRSGIVLSGYIENDGVFSNVIPS